MKKLERNHQKLLEELLKAKKRVEKLEQAVLDSAVSLGLGVSKPEEVKISSKKQTGKILTEDILGLEIKEEDISEYIGSEGDDETRPKLGEDAPDCIRPKTERGLSPDVANIAIAHPDDSVSLNYKDSKSSLSLEVVESSNDMSEQASSGKAKVAIEQELEEEGKSKDILLSGLSDEEQLSKFKSSDSTIKPSSKDNFINNNLELEKIVYRKVNPGILDWDLQSASLEYNLRWVELVGRFSNEDSPLRYLSKRLSFLGGESFDDVFSSLLRGEQASFIQSVHVKHKKEEDSWLTLYATSYKNKDNTPNRVLLILTELVMPPNLSETLKLNEEKFRLLTEGFHDVVCRFDKNGKLLYASPSLSRYVGKNSSHVQGLTLQEMGLKGDLSIFTNKLEQVFNLSIPVQSELRLITPMRRIVVLSCKFWPELGPDGEVLSVTVQGRDTTAARRIAENYKALFNQLVDGFALFSYEPLNRYSNSYLSDDFVFMALNPSLAKMLRVDPKEVIGRRVSEVFGSQADLWTNSCLAPVLDKNAPTFVKMRVQDHSLFEVSSYSPERGRVACIIKDVTVINAIANEVRLNEARLAALYRLSHMDSASESEVIRFSLDQAVQLTGSEYGFLFIPSSNIEKFQFTYWSQSVVNEYEKRNQPLPIFPNKTVMNKLENDKHILRKAIIENGSSHTEIQDFAPFVPANRFMLAPVVEDGKIVCVAGVCNKGGVYEETDLRQLELFINGLWFLLRRRWFVQGLQNAKETAEAASKSKNEFLANVSHELRTPLNGILGMLQLLQQTELSQSQMEYVVTANHSCRSLLRIISDILDFSKIEAGRLELKPQFFDFVSTVRTTLDMFSHEAVRKKVVFALDADSNIPKILFGDDARIRQLIFNIVGNAFKFTDEGHIKVFCSRLPYSKKGFASIYFSVSDTGIGIPEDKIDKIFKAFTQLDGTHTRRYSGTGLGLGIVRRLLQLMGGSLCVESEEGIGTTIHCSISLNIPEEITNKMEQGFIETKTDTFVPLHILVAEDDPTNRFTIDRMLNKIGHKVVCINDGRQALEALQLENFDCLITDIQMPVMDGEELIKRIREENYKDISISDEVCSILDVSKSSAKLLNIPADLPVIALTAHTMTGDKEHFLALGINYYLSKPILMEELSDSLNRVGRLVKFRKSHKN